MATTPATSLILRMPHAPKSFKTDIPDFLMTRLAVGAFDVQRNNIVVGSLVGVGGVLLRRSLPIPKIPLPTRNLPQRVIMKRHLPLVGIRNLKRPPRINLLEKLRLQRHQFERTKMRRIPIHRVRARKIPE